MIDRMKNFLERHVPKRILEPLKMLTGLFAHNFIQKFLSLIAAFMMWFFVMEAQDPMIEGSYEVSVTTSNNPEGFMIESQEKTINVKAMAPRSYIAKYNDNAFRAYADLEGFGAGVHEVIPQVVMPQGFELVETDPPVVHVMIDLYAERQFPVEIVTTGNISSESAIKSMTNSMDVVTVMGSKTLVEKVTRVYGTLNFSNNTASFEAQIPMKPVDENNNPVINVRVIPSVVTVGVELESGVAKKIVPIVAELTAADGWEVTKINVEPAQIEITGAESLINSIVTIKTDPVTVQTGQRAFKSKIKLNIPKGITVKEHEATVSAEVVRRTVTRDAPNSTETNPTTDANQTGTNSNNAN